MKRWPRTSPSEGILETRLQRLPDKVIVSQSHPGAAWPPTPAHSLTERPAAIVVGGPTPGIGRYPGIPGARIVRPCSASKRIPARTGKVRPPHRTPAAADEASVVIHVVDAVGVGRVPKRGRVGVALVVLHGVVIPLVEWLLRYVLRNHGRILCRQVEGHGLVLTNGGRPRRLPGPLLHRATPPGSPRSTLAAGGRDCQAADLPFAGQTSR